MTRRNQLTRKPPTQHQLIRAIFDVWEFCDLIDYHGGRSSFGECHFEAMRWANRDDASNKKLVLMPRAHLKSTLFTVLKIMHRIYQNPNIRIFVGTATKFLSGAFIRELKTYFEDEWLQDNVWNNRPHYPGRLIPLMDRGYKKRRDESAGDETSAEDKKVVWRNDALQVIRTDILKEPTVTVGSVGSLATGFHYDELCLDDVVTFDNVSTKDKNDRTFSWINDLESVLDDEYLDEESQSVLNSVANKIRDKEERNLFKQYITKISRVGATSTVVGTRYDKYDYYGFILEKQADIGFDVYERNIYQNGVNAEDGYLWDGKFTKEREKYLRIQLTPRRFASQYLNQIMAEEDKVLSWDNARFVHESCIHLKPGTSIVEVTLKDQKPFEMQLRLVIDPAAGITNDADMTAIVVGGVSPTNELFVLDLKMSRWRIAEWITQAWILVKKWNLPAITIETVGFAKTFTQTIRESVEFKDKPVAVLDYHPGNTSKKLRIENNLSPLFQNSMVYFSTHLENYTELQDQINFFPRETVRDDGVDVMSILKELSKPRIKKDPAKQKARLDRVNSKYGGYW